MKQSILLTVGLLLLAGTIINPLAPAAAQGVAGPQTACGETIYGLTADGRLIGFNSDTPGRVDSNVAITGLLQGESLLGIDYRPALREIFGLSDQNRLYIIDSRTGVARFTAPLSTNVAGSSFGVDFNPVPDRLRVVSNTGQNLRINVETGAATIDGALAYVSGDPNAGQTPDVVAAAYANNFAGATTTTLYVIDAGRDILAIQNPPNAGQLVTVGALGVDTTEQVGFDIAAGSSRAFAALTPSGGSVSNLFIINLGTGAATPVGQIGGGVAVRDITVAPRPARIIYALTSRNRLIAFTSENPIVTSDPLRLRGLRRGETLLGIDFRPANGRLYALGSSGTIYTINLRTGNLTPRPVSPFSAALNGTSFGIDFNPTVDRIRLVSDATQNLRINPDTGEVAAVDTGLAYAAGDAGAGQAPNIVAAGYTNNFAGATTTVLYGIDATRDVLVTQNPPNNGTLNTVGSLGVNASSNVSFDIFGCDNEGFVALTLEGETAAKLYKINLTTGALRLIDTIGAADSITGIAVQ